MRTDRPLKMFQVLRKPLVTQFCLLLLVVLIPFRSMGAVLCIESGEGFSIEAGEDGRCKSPVLADPSRGESNSNAPQITSVLSSSHCISCIDVPLPDLALIEATLRTSAHCSLHVDFPVFDRTFEFLPSSEGNSPATSVSYLQIPARPFEVELRTIVLRI